MIFDENGNPIEQNGKGLNRPDGFGNIPDSGPINVVKCSKCGQQVIYTREMKQTTPEERKCPKCGNELGVW